MFLADFHTVWWGLSVPLLIICSCKKNILQCAPKSKTRLTRWGMVLLSMVFPLSSLYTNQAHGWMFEHIQLHYKSMCEILGQSKNSSDAKHGIKIEKLSYSLKIMKCVLKNKIVLIKLMSIKEKTSVTLCLNRITSYICSFVYCDVSEFLKSLQG